MPTKRDAGLSPIYQLKVTLRDIRPPIWRRIQVPADVTLYRLHLTLQAVMGWENEHLYEFVRQTGLGRLNYGEPDPDYGREIRSARRTRLNEVAPAEKARLVYKYDFGDGWEHDILVEKVVPREADARYPRCLAGRRACPPEDCGGTWGYESLLGAIADPDDPEHASMLEWLGGEFDPEAFDLDAINRALGTARLSRA